METNGDVKSGTPIRIVMKGDTYLGNIDSMDKANKKICLTYEENDKVSSEVEKADDDTKELIEGVEKEIKEDDYMSNNVRDRTGYEGGKKQNKKNKKTNKKLNKKTKKTNKKNKKTKRH